MEQPYLLELDGKAAGRLFSVESPDAPRDPVDEAVIKQLQLPPGQELVLGCGTGMSRAAYAWIGSSFGGAAMRKDGAVVRLNAAGNPVTRIEFQHALVVGLLTPQLERGANKDGVLVVRLRTELISINDPRRANLAVYRASQQKVWKVHSFRLRIDGLETECAKVTRVAPLELKLGIKEKFGGSSRLPELYVTKPTYSQLSIELAGASAGGFSKWWDAALHDEDLGGKSGTLEFFAPHSTKAYFGIRFGALWVQSHSKSADAKTFRVKMSFDAPTFYAGAAAIA